MTETIDTMSRRDWIDPAAIYQFVVESNKIEGILRDPTPNEIEAHLEILDLDTLSIPDLKKFVSVVQPGAVFRLEKGLDVRVGDYYPPPGGPEITKRVDYLLKRINRFTVTPYEAHLEYEQIHPFTDGNGRSGRVVWLWHVMMTGKDWPWVLRRGFLHMWYYQSLQAASK